MGTVLTFKGTRTVCRNTLATDPSDAGYDYVVGKETGDGYPEGDDPEEYY